MTAYKHAWQTRRAFLREAVALPGTFLILSTSKAIAWQRVVQTTPACADDDDVTPSETTGPFYKPNSPQRTSLREPDIPGTPMVVRGVVLSATCTPIAHALLDFWHADDQGKYDNTGYRLRGHQFTDDAGRYTLETIMPGLYPGRTRHFHVRVQALNQPILTTQLYFPGEPDNRRDWIFKPALLMKVQGTDAGKVAAFNFVLDEQLRKNRTSSKQG
jgi:protocatechuate 3,4-dioxygenase beta subunit